jgi:hypothetical protein
MGPNFFFYIFREFVNTPEKIIQKSNQVFLTILRGQILINRKGLSRGAQAQCNVKRSFTMRFDDGY